MHNVERLETRRFFSDDPFFTITSTGTLIVHGTGDADRITVSLPDGTTGSGLQVVVSPIDQSNGDFAIYHEIKVKYNSIKRLYIDAGDGDDLVSIGNMHMMHPATVLGGEGNDTIGIDSAAANYVDGGDGNDVIGNGEAFLSDWGKKDRDVLNYAFSIPSFAGAPSTLLGGDGDDTLSGDTNDQIDGGTGNNTAQISADSTLSPDRANALAHDYYARLNAANIEVIAVTK